MRVGFSVQESPQTKEANLTPPQTTSVSEFGPRPVRLSPKGYTTATVCAFGLIALLGVGLPSIVRGEQERRAVLQDPIPVTGTVDQSSVIRDRSRYRIRYHYEVDGHRYTGSYPDSSPMGVGRSVELNVSRSHPDMSRSRWFSSAAAEEERSEALRSAGLVGFFAFAVIGFLGWNLRRDWTVLRDFQATPGEVKSVQVTKGRNGPIYTVEVAFSREGSHQMQRFQVSGNRRWRPEPGTATDVLFKPDHLNAYLREQLVLADEGVRR